MSSTSMPAGFGEYTFAWIAALPHERAAGTMMLDEKYEQPEDFIKNESDANSYTWGRIGKHNVVIASLPAGEYGTTTAAVTVQGLRSSFPHMRFGLLVGIGAGVPGEKHNIDGTVTVRRDIRLGDVIVSSPDRGNGGVVQYDLIKKNEQVELKGFLNSPPMAIRHAVSALQAEHELEDSKTSKILANSIERYPRTAAKYSRPSVDMDRLFLASCRHTDAGDNDDCQRCLELEEIKRPSRNIPEIHYGTIASGNTLIKNAEYRDELLRNLRDVNVDPLCFEMEAAGLMNTFPCLVIRGICDYADSHKNDAWQRYAAATAAAFAKELLEYVDVAEVKRSPELRKLLGNS